MATALPLDTMATQKRTRPFYARVAALGFGLIALAGTIVVVVGIVAGEASENVSFGLIFLVLGLLVAAAAWTARSWALILAAVNSLALLAFVGPFSSFSLSHPESATEFVPVVLILAGGVLGLVGSIIALVQARRRTTREYATGTERLGLATVMSAIALAALVSVVLTATGRTTVSAEARTGAMTMEIKSFAFAPQTYRARAGDTVRMVIKNDDSSLHTFTLPAAAVNVAIPPGSEKLVEFKAPAAGVYRFFCIPHSTDNGGMMEGMVGTLVVE